MRPLALAALLAVLGTAAPALANDIVSVPVCDTEGHCDRHCYVSDAKPFVRCGF